MNSTKKGIGYSPLTDKVYLGRQNKEKGLWIGEKEDITQQFLHVSFQYFEESTVRTISTGNKKNLIINVVKDKKGIESAINRLQKELKELSNKCDHHITHKGTCSACGESDMNQENIY